MRSPSAKMAEEQNLVDETDTQFPTCSGKLVRGTEHAVQNQLDFQSDLREEGVPQDAIFEDEEQIKEINEKLKKFKGGSRSKSIRDDCKNDDLTLSEESTRVIYEIETWNCVN